jgi:hypothetical protein
MGELNLMPYDSLDGRPFFGEMKLVIRADDFRNVKFKEGKITYLISNCNFNKLIIENFHEIQFPDISISFTSCFIGEIKVENIVSKNISLHFGSTIISGKIKDGFLQSVEFNNCILNDNIFLINLNKINISYTKENIFLKRWNDLLVRISIDNISQLLDKKQSFNIYDCSTVIASSNITEEGKGGIYRQKLVFDNQKLGYKLTDKQKKLISLNLHLSYDAKEDCKVKVADLIFDSVTISGAPTGKILFENTKIGSWFLHNFLPKGEVSFYNIRPSQKLQLTSKIEFHQSNLDNTWFDNINFSEYSLISFYRTKFSKTIFTACNFPKNSISFDSFTTLENIHYPEKKKDNYYKDQYEIYLQLKMALEATGNFHESQKLFAISNDALRKIKDVSRWDKFILWINRNSNNHGLSIKRPFLLFFGFSILFYILYLWSLNRIFNANEIDWDLVGYYFSFIDLTHRNDFLVEKPEFNSCSLFFDYLNKIVISFFIYQFIAAFRKYGKS